MFALHGRARIRSWCVTLASFCFQGWTHQTHAVKRCQGAQLEWPSPCTVKLMNSVSIHCVPNLCNLCNLFQWCPPVISVTCRDLPPCLGLSATPKMPASSESSSAWASSQQRRRTDGVGRTKRATETLWERAFWELFCYSESFEWDRDESRERIDSGRENWVIETRRDLGKDTCDTTRVTWVTRVAWDITRHGSR